VIRSRNFPSSPSEAESLVGTAPEETLVADSRAGLTPAQMVEHKLAGLLRSNPLLVSQSRLRTGSLSRRPHDG